MNDWKREGFSAGTLPVDAVFWDELQPPATRRESGTSHVARRRRLWAVFFMAFSLWTRLGQMLGVGYLFRNFGVKRRDCRMTLEDQVAGLFGGAKWEDL